MRLKGALAPIISSIACSVLLILTSAFCFSDRAYAQYLGTASPDQTNPSMVFHGPSDISKPNVVQGGTVSIQSVSISKTQTRDGQTLTLGYQIKSTSAVTAYLGCTLHGPGGSIIEDDTHEGDAYAITLSPGTNWYYRDFFVNVPPGVPSGTYSVECGVSWGTSGFTSVTNADALKLLDPISVRIPILMYHKFGPVAYSEYWVSTDMFQAQMRALKAYGYTAVTLYDVMNCRAGTSSLPKKPIVITADDAYEDVLTDAYPVIESVGTETITSFVPTGKIGGDNSWDTGDDDPVILHLSWAEIQLLSRTGLVDFESHTVNHPDITTLNADEAYLELANSASTLENALGYRPLFLAWPYGQYSSTDESDARESDYFAALDSGGGVEPTCANKWALKRVYIDWNTSVDYDPTQPGNFLFNKIGESVPLPVVSVFKIVYAFPLSSDPPGISSIKRNQPLDIQAIVTNSGQSGQIAATVRLSTDPSGKNIVFDSNTSKKDAVGAIHPGASYWKWRWTVPGNAATGQYYISVGFYDNKHVLGFGFSNPLWQKAFVVSQ